MSKNKPKYTLQEFAELKNINIKTLRNRIGKAKIKLEGERLTGQNSDFMIKRSSSSLMKLRYELGYLNEMLGEIL